MERGSDTHGPRVDEQLKHEVSALVQGASLDEGRDEGRAKEPFDDDVPSVGHRPVLDEAPPAGLGEDELEARTELATSLHPDLFPATAEVLRAAARDAAAAPVVQSMLERLPDDRTYETVGEVWRALGHEVEATTAIGREDAPPPRRTDVSAR